MAAKECLVWAEWDAEAGVYYVSKSDVPGLVAEAEDLEALLAKLRVLIPELVRLNAHLIDFELDGDLPIALMSKRLEHIRAVR